MREESAGQRIQTRRVRSSYGITVGKKGEGLTYARKVLSIATIAVVALTLGAGCTHVASSERDYTSEGFLLLNRGECSAAAISFNEALKYHPDNAEAYYGRSVVQVCLGQYDAAISDYSSAIRLDPGSFHFSYSGRAWLYEQTGDGARALADYNEAIKLDHIDPVIYNERAELEARMSQIQSAEADLDTATALAGNSPPARYLNTYAWILATSPAAQIRNGPSALRYATWSLNYPNEYTFIFATSPSAQPGNSPFLLSPAITAEEAAEHRNAHFFDTLAACYAENGQFDEAIKWEKKACSLWSKQSYMPIMLKEMNERLALYEEHQPYREGKL